MSKQPDSVIGNSFTRAAVVIDDVRHVDVLVEMHYIDRLVKVFLHLIENSTTLTNVIKPDYEQVFKKWIRTGFYLRAFIVTGDKKYFPFNWETERSKAKNLRTITTLAQLWSYIGTAKDTTFNINFRPVFPELNKEETLTLEQYVEFTFELEKFSRALTLGKFPNQMDGDERFMAMIWINDKLKSHSPDHAAYVFASSIISKVTSDAWYNDYSRITYATEGDIDCELSLDILVRIFRGGTERPEVCRDESDT